MKVFVLGATGTAGRATVAAVQEAGQEAVALVRPETVPSLPKGIRVLRGHPTPDVLDRTMSEVRPDAVVSCMASRTGLPEDAWAVDHAATVAAIRAAERTKVRHFVLLSAICVQKPRLAFQHAKLAAEAELRRSGLDWTIVRPTAFFKSLSGQVARVIEGKPMTVFGDGRLTACKPISDRDLGRFIADCLTDPAKRRAILPIGGPGPAISPADQAAILSHLLKREVPLWRVPIQVMRGIVSGLSLGSRLLTSLHPKSEFAKIGHYYGTESMLHWNGARYDADATPEFGSDTLEDHYRALVSGVASTDLGAHAVFGRG